MAKTKQIQQISTFLSAYPKDVVEAGIEAWRTGKMPMEGMVTDTPMAQNYSELTIEAQEFIKAESEAMLKIMPFCKCGHQYMLAKVCPSCARGQEGFKSKFVCVNRNCNNEEYFKETKEEKIAQLKGGNDGNK